MKNRELPWLWIALGAVIVSLIAITAVLIAQEADRPVVAPQSRSVQGMGSDAVRLTERGVVVGHPETPHKVVLYEDMSCPACAAFSNELSGDLENLKRSGTITIEYVTVSFLDSPGNGLYSTRAANVLAAVSQEDPEHFEAAQREMLRIQPAGGSTPTDEDILASLESVGVSVTPELRALIEEQTFAGWVEEHSDEARSTVEGTPTVLINGDKVNPDPASIRAALAEIE